MSTVAIVVSSPGRGSRLASVAHATSRLIADSRNRVASIELSRLPYSALMAGDTEHPKLRWSHRLISNAGAVVVITPSYEASCSPVINTWLETLPRNAFAGKSTQAIGVGATRAQSSGLDYTLRRRFTDLQAASVGPACFLFDTWITRKTGSWQLDSIGVDLLTQRLSDLIAIPGVRTAA